jgi:hypothetical protein
MHFFGFFSLFGTIDSCAIFYIKTHLLHWHHNEFSLDTIPCVILTFSSDTTICMCDIISLNRFIWPLILWWYALITYCIYAWLRSAISINTDISILFHFLIWQHHPMVHYPCKVVAPLSHGHSRQPWIDQFIPFLTYTPNPEHVFLLAVFCRSYVPTILNWLLDAVIISS